MSRSLLNSETFTSESILLVTGTLAASALRQVVTRMKKDDATLRLHVHVLNIQVAALLTTSWIQRKLQIPSGVSIDRVILPGYTRGDLKPLEAKLERPVALGPRNLHDLPEFLGQAKRFQYDDSQHNIEILAEINDAAHLTEKQVLQLAQNYQRDGADLIDLGCDPATDRSPWREVGQRVRQLRQLGMRVSIDSFHPEEVMMACEAGAELVLSVNQSNVRYVGDWAGAGGQEEKEKPGRAGAPGTPGGIGDRGHRGDRGRGVRVVAIPDQPGDLASLDRTVTQLESQGVDYLIDPILEPIGLGFARSLGRYLEIRGRYPHAQMMMGVGNLTEMTEVDSAGVNALLIGFCQELNIRHVLTTQVINWARSSVREIDIARRLMHFAVTHQVPPKHLDDRLVMLRDPKLRAVSERQLDGLSQKLTDRNIRLFADPQKGLLHAMNKELHVTEADPFALFKQLKIEDASHAFYLGMECAKASMALHWHKNYVQDEPLRLGGLEDVSGTRGEEADCPSPLES